MKHEIYMYFEQDIHSCLSQGNGNKHRRHQTQNVKEAKRNGNISKTMYTKSAHIENGKKSNAIVVHIKNERKRTKKKNKKNSAKLALEQPK